MAGNQVAIVLKIIDKASGNMNKISKSAASMSKSMSSMGRNLTQNVTLPLAAIGVAGVKMASDFDKSMRNIQSMGHQTESELGALGDRFKSMSMDMTQTTDSADGLAKAYYNIQSAGFAGEEGMEVLSVATKAASAGLTDTKIAAESIMGVLSSYQLEAKDAARVSDIMFQAVTRGMLTFDQLAAAMPSVTGQASALGVSIEEVSAAFSTMSKAGVNAANASTQLSAMMTELTKGNTQLTAAARALGFESSRAMLEQKGLAETLRLLEQYAASAGIKVDSLFNNIRAAKGVFALTGANARVFADDLSAMGDSVGATQAAFDEQMKSFSATFANFKNTVGVFLMEIGEQLLPILTEVLNAIRPLFQAFANLPDPIKKTVVVVGLLVAGLGPLLMIVGKVMSIFGALKAAFIAIPAVVSTITGALPMLGTAFTALSGPIGIAAAAIAGLIAFGPKIIEFAKKVFKGIQDFFSNPIDAITKGLGKIMGFGVTKPIQEATLQTAERLSELKSVLTQFGVDINKETMAAADQIVRTGNLTARTMDALRTTEDSALSASLMSMSENHRTFHSRLSQMTRKTLNLAKYNAQQTARAIGNSFIQTNAQVVNSINQARQAAAIPTNVTGFRMPTSGGTNQGVRLMSIAKKRKKHKGEQAMSNAEFASLVSELSGGFGAPGAGLDAMGGGMAVSASGGDINITIENINVSPEKEQMIKDVMSEIAKGFKRRGGLSGRRITGG